MTGIIYCGEKLREHVRIGGVHLMREFDVCNNSFQENKLLEASILSIIKEELPTALL